MGTTAAAFNEKEIRSGRLKPHQVLELLEWGTTAFQHRYGLERDGKAGKNTREMLDIYLRQERGLQPPVVEPGLPVELIHGIDISAWQKTIDMEKVAAAQIGFCIIKSTEDDRYHFKMAAALAKLARSLGIVVGGYHFLKLDVGDISKEIGHVLRHMTYEDGDLPPAADYERGRTKKIRVWDKKKGRHVMKRRAIRTKVAHNANLLDAILLGRAMAREYGVKPGFYFNWPSWSAYAAKADSGLKEELADVYGWDWTGDYSRNSKNKDDGILGAPATDSSPATGAFRYINDGVFKPDDFVRLKEAGWRGEKIEILQWTGKGKVDGVRGNCDRNIMTASTMKRLITGVGA